MKASNLFNGKIKYHLILVSIIFAVLAYLFGSFLSPQHRIFFAIMIFIAFMWFTEAIPLFLTSLLVPFLAVTLVKLPSDVAIKPFFDPIVMLILGGFVISVAMQKTKLSEVFAGYFLRFSKGKPYFTLLLIFSFTFLISMWISNSAAAAIVMPIAVAILVKNHMSKGAQFPKAVVLGIAYAATIGGLTTIVGTPPNAIASQFLSNHGFVVDFLGWMIYAIPFAILLLMIMWGIMCFRYRTDLKKLTIPLNIKTKFNISQKTTLFILLLTIVLWLTTRIHKIPASVIAIIPIILFYVFQVLEPSDFAKSRWSTLILIGGGLSLGSAISYLKFDLVVAEFIKGLIQNQPAIAVFLLLAIATILMTAVASNTATAAILIPIIIPLAASLNLNVISVAVLVALASSLDFIVPVGTPPTAIAYSTGYLKTKDILITGTLLSLISVIFLVVFSMLW